MRISDWSSDVCSSDLLPHRLLHQRVGRQVVIVEILFDDRGVRRGEGDRLRPDLRRYVGKLLPRPAGGKGDLADVLNQRLPAIIRSEEHTSELQSLMRISYAVFCLTKKKN